MQKRNPRECSGSSFPEVQNARGNKCAGRAGKMSLCWCNTPNGMKGSCPGRHAASDSKTRPGKTYLHCDLGLHPDLKNPTSCSLDREADAISCEADALATPRPRLKGWCRCREQDVLLKGIIVRLCQNRKDTSRSGGERLLRFVPRRPSTSKWSRTSKLLMHDLYAHSSYHFQYVRDDQHSIKYGHPGLPSSLTCYGTPVTTRLTGKFSRQPWNVACAHCAFPIPCPGRDRRRISCSNPHGLDIC